MCKKLSEGGQRCAAHTKERLERKARAMREAADKVATLGTEGMEAFQHARTEWEEAAVDYASTPTGSAAMSERLAQAEAANDTHTSAMLTTIIQRGDAMRAANEQIRAALMLGQFTEADLPDAELSEAIVSDQNNNPLSPDDQKAWLRLLDAVHETSSSSEGPFATQHYASLPDQIVAWDSAIASSATTDAELCNAAYYVAYLALDEDKGYVDDPSDWYDDDGWGGPDMRAILMKRWMASHAPVLQAQVRRSLAHPNADMNTFRTLSVYLPPSEVAQMPQCPDNIVTNFTRGTRANLSPEAWQSIRERSKTSLPLTVFLATNDVDERAQERAQDRIVGFQWDTASTNDLAYLNDRLNEALPAKTQGMVRESLHIFVRDYGDDEAKARILPKPPAVTDDAAGGKQGVSLIRRSARKNKTPSDSGLLVG